MKITVFGSGYVGLVTSACFAEIGNNVLCYDIEEKKINDLQKGVVGIYEPKLSELIKRNSTSIRFTNSITEASNFSDHIMICVGTPENKDGSANLKYIKDAISSIFRVIKTRPSLTITIKSTVPPGTSQQINEFISSIKENTKIKKISLASNPEFLKEGTAINDFMKPDRIIIGLEETGMKKYFSGLYGKLAKKIIFMDIASAELTKYASNAMLASRITFINEISRFADVTNASIDMVIKGMVSDERIGSHFLNPGPGYGGSCFPKDVSALKSLSSNLGINADLIEAINKSNNTHKNHLIDRVANRFNKEIKNKVFAIWGLTFKANTDDIRESFSLDLIKFLLSKGAKIQAYDPKGMNNSSNNLSNRNLYYCKNKAETIKNASCLVIATEWESFRVKNLYNYMKKNGMKESIVFDFRNLYKDCSMKKIEYHAIGGGEGN